MIFPSLITALTILLYMVLSHLVMKARGRYEVAAPAISGHPDFERRYRVQMNTLEQMAIFLPSLWLFTIYWVPQVRLGAPWSGPHVALVLGLVWLFGRVWYAMGYYQDSTVKKRGPGFFLSSLVTCILLFWSLAGIGYILLHLPLAVS